LKAKKEERMTMSTEKKLADLGLTLPQAAPPAANYVPYVISGNLLFLAGQLPFDEKGEIVKGTVGSTITPEEAQEAAKRCGVQILAQTKAALGSLDRVRRVVKLGGFVACTPDFTAQPAVINGASNLMADVFGDKGKHARFAVGVPCLPLGAAVEIDAVIEIEQ